MPKPPEGRGAQRPWHKPEVKLPKEIRRADNGRLFVEFKRRFSDGTGFRRAADFAPTALAGALDFLDRAKDEFSKGKPRVSAEDSSATLSVSEWCDHCLNTLMPSQSTNRRPRYGDMLLKDYREVVRIHVKPAIGSILLADLQKAEVAEFAAKLPNSEIRAKVLYVLTRIFESAEAKGKRKKGTNPCKGVPTNKP